MSMNRVQFQSGLSLPQFLARYGTEAQCFQALVQMRWPEGFLCPGCQYRRSSHFQRGTQWLWQRAQCRAQTSVTAGTMTAPRNPLALGMLAPKVWFHVLENRSKPSMPMKSNRTDAFDINTLGLTSNEVLAFGDRCQAIVAELGLLLIGTNWDPQQYVSVHKEQGNVESLGRDLNRPLSLRH